MQTSESNYPDSNSLIYHEYLWFPVGPGYFGPWGVPPFPMEKEWTISGPETGEYWVRAWTYGSLRTQGGQLLDEDDQMDQHEITVLE